MVDVEDVSFPINGVFVINMDRRPDRWAAFQTAWRDILPWELVVRLPASEGVGLPGYGATPWFRGRKRDRTWAGRAGCALSHASAWREAQARGWDRTLIFEDDAVPSAPMTGLPDVLWLDDWDLLYLGGREPEGPMEETGPGVVRIKGALDCHAYAINGRLRDWAIERLPEPSNVWRWIARERAIDRWLRREVGRRFRVLMCRPQIAIQTDDLSDITNRRESSYADREVLSVERAFRNASEIRRTREIVTDRIRAAIKSIVGF